MFPGTGLLLTKQKKQLTTKNYTYHVSTAWKKSYRAWEKPEWAKNYVVPLLSPLSYLGCWEYSLKQTNIQAATGIKKLHIGQFMALGLGFSL